MDLRGSETYSPSLLRDGTSADYFQPEILSWVQVAATHVRKWSGCIRNLGCAELPLSLWMVIHTQLSGIRQVCHALCQIRIFTALFMACLSPEELSGASLSSTVPLTSSSCSDLTAPQVSSSCLQSLLLPFRCHPSLPCGNVIRNERK